MGSPLSVPHTENSPEGDNCEIIFQCCLMVEGVREDDEANDGAVVLSDQQEMPHLFLGLKTKR